MNPSDYRPPGLLTATNNVISGLQTLRQALEPFSETAPLDAQVMMAQVLQRSRTWVLAHPEAILSSDETTTLNQAAARLACGEPLPYVLGHWEFYGLELEVGPAVLIPRPETELLVFTALEWLHSHPSALRAADVGTGSGCIAVALATQLPGLSIYAFDQSRPALEIARRNADRHAVSASIHFFQGDLLSSMKGPFDLICANLPYIPRDQLETLPVAANEPRLALDGGPDGLDVIRRLISDLPRLLASDCLCLFEIEASQGKAVMSLARSAFPGAVIHLLQDLDGYDRFLSIMTA